MLCTIRMNKNLLLVWLSLFAVVSVAQNKATDAYSAIDKKVLQLPYNRTLTTPIIAGYIQVHFRTDKEKLRALYTWLVTHFKYDVDRQFTLDYKERDSTEVARFIQSGKGVCIDYAALFHALCSELGIPSYVIEGYTKQNGKVDVMSHAWCAARVDQSWYLFDPTWGAGHVKNNQFVRKINEAFFMVQPTAFIKSHMPYDYLWQFLEYPVTNQEFLEGKTGINKSKPYFDVKASLERYEKQDDYDRMVASAGRIEANGVVNALIYDNLKTLTFNIHVLEDTRRIEWHNKQVALYNAAVLDCNEAVRSLNAFIDYRNKQFLPIKPDPLIKGMLEEVGDKLDAAHLKLSQIVTSDESLLGTLRQMATSMDDLSNQLSKQRSWLNAYLSKGKLGRKMMFVDKVTWFGIPLN